MRYREFCGRKTAAIALGTGDFGGKIDEGHAFEYMDAYAAMGGNLIDTARVYGDFANEIQGGSEECIGRWMEANRNRDDIVLSTKGGHPDMHDMHTGRLSRKDILYDIQLSLDALRTDHADIYWLHRDDRSRPVGDIMETLTDLYERGMLRYAGVSNWKEDRILEANAYAQSHGLISLYANQPQFSLARQELVEDDTLCQMDTSMYRMHMEQNMPCMAFSSQAKGFLAKMAANGLDALPDKAKRRFLTPGNLEILERIQSLSAQTGLTVSALSLLWLMEQPFTTIPIVGMSRLEHVEALHDACDASITPQQRDYLRKMI